MPLSNDHFGVRFRQRARRGRTADIRRIPDQIPSKLDLWALGLGI